MWKKLALSALLVSSCTNTANFRPTMASDPPELGIEGIVLANELSRAFVQGEPGQVCSQIELGYQESQRFTVARYRQGQADAADRFRCVFFRQFATDADRNRAVENHVRAGLALSDYFCANFFDRIAEHLGKRRFARNVTNDVGAMVSTVLGLAAAGSRVTGGIGAAFGLLDGTWRNYDDSFLVDADLPTLQGLVQSEQDKFRRENTAMPTNFPDANTRIIRYANLCSFVGMKRLLTASMRDRARANAAPENIVRATAREFMQAYDQAQHPETQPAAAPEATVTSNDVLANGVSPDE